MSTLTTESSCIDEAIAALGRADRARAAQLLAQAIAEDPTSEGAWLWFSEIVQTVAERKFCLERVLAVNPTHQAATFGMGRLAADVAPLAPTVSRAQLGPQQCTFPGCDSPVSRPGFHYCYGHWKAVNKAPTARPLSPTSAPTDTLLTTSALAERVQLHSRSLHLRCAELGWVTKAQHGWKVTEAGTAVGAVQKYHPQTGVPFVLWPERVATHPALVAAANPPSVVASAPAAPPSTTSERSFRERFPAQHRTTDGHYVRSKAEMLIDNWLYTADIAHAYERQLPIAEEAYCDFYVPSGRVFIEYWGMERDQKYLARKQAKQALYQKYGLHLIELTDDHLKNLDDHLPRMLLKYGVDVS